MKYIGIACLNTNRAIGYKNKLIYRIPSELAMFKKLTTTNLISNHISIPHNSRKPNILIMGRKTFDSIHNKPLPNRLNCVISSQADIYTKNNKYDNALFFKSIKDAFDYTKSTTCYNNTFICGGSSLYNHCMENGLLDYLVLSEIKKPLYNIGDTFFSNSMESFTCIYNEGHVNVPCIDIHTNVNKMIDYDVNIYINSGKHLTPLVIPVNNTKIPHNVVEKSYTDEQLITLSKNNINNKGSMGVSIGRNMSSSSNMNVSDEFKYLDVLKDIMDNGSTRKTRNSTTISKFGVNLDFDISTHFPLLTTKRVYWKGIIKELLWFIKADTNSMHLSSDNVRIWDGNSSRDFLDKNGLSDYNTGDCGPIYGFQWRHFNAPYRGADEKYEGEGVDQLQNIINLIDTDPSSRRMIMSAWNPVQLKEMCLPPCHVLYQFYVRIDEGGKKHLSCSMYQRSGDMFLGIPFNIASTAALTYMVAHITNSVPDKISIKIGDAHIYSNHLEAVNKQLSRIPSKFPTLTINGSHTNINNIVYEDFELNNYNPQSTIKADMVA